MAEEILNEDQLNQQDQQVPQQEEPPKKLSVQEFASKIKSKYPQYKDVDDNLLTSKMLDKYPIYKDQVDFTEKKNAGQPSGIGGQQPKPSGTPLTPSPSPSSSQKGAEKPSWQTSALNPEFAAQEAQKQKEQQAYPLPYKSAPSVVPKTKAPQRQAVAQPPKKDDGIWSSLKNFGEDVADYGKYFYNNIMEGVGEVSSASSDVMMNILTKVLPDEAIGGTGTPEQNRESALKSWRENIEPTIRTATKQIAGAKISSEKEKKFNDNFVLSAIGGLGKMIPAMVAPEGTGFILQAYDGGLQSVNNSEAGRNLPESTKTIYGTANGIVMGALMKLQLDKIFGKQSDKVASKITADVLNDLLKKTEGAITKDAFEVAVNDATRSLKSKIVKAGGDITKAGITGTIFGGLTAATDITSREILNRTTKKEVFEPTSWGDAWSEILKSGASMGIGGLVLGGVHVPFSETRNYIKEKVLEAKTEEDINKLKNEIVGQVNNGKVPAADAQKIMDVVDEYTSINKSIPADVQNRGHVVDKIKQSNDLKTEANNTLESAVDLHPAFQAEKVEEAQAMSKVADNIDNSISGKPIYKIGDREVDRNTFEQFVKNNDATTKDVDLYVEGDDAMSTELEKIGGVSKVADVEAGIPEHTIKTQTNDKENIPGLPSKVGVGEEPVTTEPIKGASAEEVSTGGVLQAPRIEGEGKGVGQKVGEEVVPQQKTVEQLRAEEQAELDSKIPNAEQYRVDGKVDRDKLTNEEDIKVFDEVYNKYDKLITPLLKEGVGKKAVSVSNIKREDFPEEQNDVRTETTQKLLNYLADTLGVERIDMKKGGYIDWIKEQTFAAQGNKGSENLAQLELALNGPKQVFDRITKYKEAQEAELPKQKGVGEVEVPKQEETKITGIDEKEVARLAKPITDRMVEIEREFENQEYTIDTAYDNEIIINDKDGEQVEFEDLPNELKDIALEYQAATAKLGEVSDKAREKALAESRKVVETEAEVIEPKKATLPEPKKQEPAKQIKEGESVDFKIGDINAKPITGEKVTIPGHEDMDTIIVRDGMSYDIYELATGLKLTSEESFTREDAIENASNMMKEKGVTARKIYTKAVKGEFDKYGVEKVKPINKSSAYEQFREEERAKALAMPYLKSESERQKFLDIAKEAKEKGLDNVAETIIRAANKRIEGGLDFDISDAKRMLDFAENAKKLAELKKENKPYPKSEIEPLVGNESELSSNLNRGFAKDRMADLPADIKAKAIDSYKKMVDIYNKYGYISESVKNLESPTLFIAKYIKSLGTKDLEKRPERIKEELDNIDKQIKAIDEAYKKEFGEEKAESEAPEQKEETQEQYVDRKIAEVKEKGKPLSEFKVGDKVFLASDWDSRFKQYFEGKIKSIEGGDVVIQRFADNPMSKRYKTAHFRENDLAILKPEGELVHTGEETIYIDKDKKAAMASIEAVAKEPAIEAPKKEEIVPEQAKSKLDKFKKKKKGEEQVDLFTQPKIAENAEESRIIESKLSKEDNPEQEPIVKTAERKAENASRTPTEELKKQIDDVTSKIEDATDVVNFPVAKIKSNETEYQGRKNKFSERSAKNVAENFDRNKFDPIVVYNHPDGNTYVLSGHSRLEGMKRRGETTIPARVYEGTPEQAKDFALKSNKLGTLQTDIENAAYYREQLKKGKSYNSILEEAKENEQQGSAKRIVSYAHLNPDGKTMGAMESLEGTEGDTNVNLSSIATKIGDIKANNEHLTNAHEDELFDFMSSDKDNIPTDKEILDPNSQISRSIASVRFNPEEPLNLNRFTNKSAERIEWEREKRDIEEQIRETRKEVNPNKTTGWTGLKERAIASLAKDKSADAIDVAAKQFNSDVNGIKTQYEKVLARKKAELKVLEEKLGKHLLREKGLIEGEKSQQSLFSIERTKSEDLNDMTDAVVDIINEFPNKTVEEVQSYIADYTGDKTRAMSRLVAQAYKEAKNVVTKDLVKDPIVRRLNRAFLNIGTTILENSKQLMDKAKELREARFSATDNTAGYETRDGKPIGFVYDTEQVARQRFDFSKLKKIGEGSDRIVFDLGDGKVLKVAKTARGLAQNVYEGDYYLSIVPQVFERGLNYVVAENTPRIKASDIVPTHDVETGQEIGTATAGEMLSDLKKFSQRDFDTHSDKLQDVLRKYGLEDALNYEVLYGDFKAGRNWGYKDGRPVHLDGGTFGGVQMLEDYKGKTNLQDDDFRAIYNESKRVKKQNADKDKYTKFHYNDVGEILGFTHGKEVYLNNEKLTAKTTSEEAGHIWINDAKNNNPHLYQAGLKKVKGTKYLKDVAASEFYKKEALKQGAEGSIEYNNYMEEEALSKAIADEGAKFATDTQKSDFKKWVIAMWKNVIKSFGIRNMTERQISEMSLQEFARRAAADVYSRVKESNIPEQYTKRELGGGEVRGITHAANEERRAELGMADREPNPESFEQWDNEAQAKIQSGYNIEEHIQKMNSGAVMSGTENAISKIFAATVDERLADNPSTENLSLAKRFIEARDVANSAAGRALGSIRGNANPLSSIADFYVAKMEANRVDDLSEKQKQEVQKDFESVQNARDEYKRLYEEAKAKNAELLAEQELNEQRKASSQKPKGEKKNYAAERQDLKNKLKDLVSKYISNTKKLGISPDGGAENFAITVEMAKVIKDIAFSHFDETRGNLTEVTRNTYETIKDIFSGIKEKDIHDVIAGEYAPERKQKSELMAEWRDVQSEAKLLNEMDRVLAGEPKTEKEELVKNQKLTDLRKKINDVKKEKGLDQYAEEEKIKKAEKIAEKNVAELEQKVADNNLEIEQAQKLRSPKLDALRERQKELNNEIDAKRKEAGIGKYSEEAKIKRQIDANNRREKEIRDKIDRGDFATKPKPSSPLLNPEFKRKHPDLYKKLLDSAAAKEDATYDFQVKMMEEEMATMPKSEKIKQGVGKAFNTIKKLTTGVDDSAAGIQAYMALIRRPVVGAKAFGEHAADFWSKKRFDRNLALIKESPIYELIEASGLSITTPKSVSAQAHEEVFGGQHYDITVKIKGKKYKILEKLLSPFERAFTSLGNHVRVIAFSELAQKAMNEGYTFEKNPEIFKGYAEMLNTETGRGRANEMIERNMNIVTKGIWSPRLMASRLNILGISDAISIATMGRLGTEGYYRKLPPKVRLEAIRSLAQYAATVTALTYSIAYAFGGEVEEDPRSGNYMGIKIGTRTYNFTGGFSQYIAQVAQDIAGGKTTENKFSPFKEQGRGIRNRFENVLHFMRGKVTPATGAIINQKYGKDYAGQPVTVESQAKNLLTPMSLRNVVSDMERDGVSSLYKSDLPNFFGINVKDERDYQRISAYKDVQLDDEQNKQLKDANILLPRIREKEFYQIKEDSGHPNGTMTDAEYKSFTDNLTKYINENIKTNMESYYNVPIRDEDGYLVDNKELQGKDLAKYKNFEIAESGDKWVVLDDKKTRYSYSDTKQEAEEKLNQITNQKLQSIVDKAHDDALKTAQEESGLQFVKKEEINIKQQK